MKVAVVPAQIVEVPATLTLTGKFGFTVIVIVFDAAGEPVAQEREEVMRQETLSEFAREELV